MDDFISLYIMHKYLQSILSCLIFLNVMTMHSFISLKLLWLISRCNNLARPSVSVFVHHFSDEPSTHTNKQPKIWIALKACKKNMLPSLLITTSQCRCSRPYVDVSNLGCEWRAVHDSDSIYSFAILKIKIKSYARQSSEKSGCDDVLSK